MDLSNDRIPSNNEQFIKAIKASADAVRDLAEAGRSHSAVVPTPRAESLAVAELSRQSDYGGEWDAHPIDAVLSQVGLLLYAAEDSMKAFANLVLSNDTPLYAHVTLARSGLEFLALAHYLGDPTMGIKERVRRSLNQRIYEAYSAEQLPVGIRQGKDVRRRLLTASTLGFETQSRKGRVKYLLPDRPTITQHIKMLLGDDALGAGIYAYTSAVSHGTGWGLLQRRERYAHGRSGDGPITTVALMHSSGDINTMALALIVGHMKAYRAYLDWTMLPADEWQTVRLRAERVVQANLRAMRAASIDRSSGV